MHSAALPPLVTLSSLGIVTGLAAEAVIAAGLSPHLACAAAQPVLARRMAQDLLNAGAEGLLSFGIAGGLEPGLAAGRVLIADQVSTAQGVFAADAGLLSFLQARLPTAEVGRIYGSDRLLCQKEAKARAYAAHRALAADMESGAVAEIAAAAGVPFAVLRVVADGAERALPPAARLPLLLTGRPAMGGILRSVLSEPAQVPALLSLARDTTRAFRALKEVAGRLALPAV